MKVKKYYYYFIFIFFISVFLQKIIIWSYLSFYFEEMANKYLKYLKWDTSNISFRYSLVFLLSLFLNIRTYSKHNYKIRDKNYSSSIIVPLPYRYEWHMRQFWNKICRGALKSHICIITQDHRMHRPLSLTNSL